MKIYYIEKCMDQKLQKAASAARTSGLKLAAGGEDIITLSIDAVSSFNRDNVFNELKKLALRHIDDFNPELDGLRDDPEFMAAERGQLMAELVMRIAPSGKRRMTGNSFS